MRKNLTRLIILLVFLLALTASMLMIVKPDTRVLYYKMRLPMEQCTPDAGFSYRCRVHLPPGLFPPEKVLLFEDGQQLERTNSSQVSKFGDGTYLAEVSDEGKYYIYLAPKENSDPFTNDRVYQAYFAIFFFSQTMGIVYLGILLSVLHSFSQFALRQIKGCKDARLLIKKSPQCIDGYLAHLRAMITRIESSASAGWRPFFVMWGKLAIATALAAFALVFMEWLFSITSVSFMDRMNLGQQVEVFLLTGLVITLVALALLVLLMAAGLALRAVRLSWVAYLLAALLPSALYTILAVLMIENFTYVVFHFGILTSTGVLRILYGILIVFVLGSIYRARQQNEWGADRNPQKPSASDRLLSGITLGLSAIALAAALIRFDPASSVLTAPEAITANHPNIILIGSDGVSAKNMSLYGYERETTPNLSTLGETSLVAENAFTNSGNTTGSIISIFTSKLTVETGVLFPPNILQGADAFQHLPGILSKAGYHTVQLGVAHYIDAYTVNVQGGFDIANQVPIHKDALTSAWRNAGYGSSAYFLYQLEAKCTDRFLHAFHLDTIENPFHLVTQTIPQWYDPPKVDELLTLLTQTEEPLFIHVHFMGTHGPFFNNQESRYSQGQEQSAPWMIDFYDDAVLAFDGFMGQLITYLKESGQYDNTLLIVYSDHAMAFATRERIPLLVHFPGDAYTSRITANVQNLDIAPTVLDYLDLDVPEWMNGSSLLSPDLANDRWIFSTRLEDAPALLTETGFVLDVSQIGPPFYQLQFIQIIACDHWYEYNLQTQTWGDGTVEQHTVPCEANDLPSQDEVFQRMIEILSEQGYDTSSLR